MPRMKTPTKDGRGAPSNRVLYAQRLLAQGRYNAAREGLMQQFGISRTSATRDLTEACRLMALEAEEERPSLRARSLRRLELIMDKAEAAGKLGDAIKAQREITRITGIAAPQEHIIKPSVLTPEQLAELTDEELDLLEKLDAMRNGPTV